MKHEKLYTLIPLENFKSVLGVDDRDDKLGRFCLTTAAYTIEQYCHRRLLVKGHFEDLAFWEERTIPLSHYPVIKVLAVYTKNREQVTGNREQRGAGNWELAEPDFYCVEPEAGEGFDIPASLVLYPGLHVLRGERSIRVVYKSGYSVDKVPPDLASACMELAMWNMNRYKGRRIGMTGNVRGGGERLELSMPENVRSLLEPYRRKLI